MCSNTAMKERKLQRKRGIGEKGSPACCPLLYKVTAAPGNQGRGCTQTNTAAAGGRGGCMCTSIPAQRKKKKGGQRALSILAILLPGKQTLCLGPCPLQNQAQTWLTSRGIRRSHWDVSSLSKIAVAIAGTRENVYKSCWKNMFHETKDSIARTGLWLENKRMGKKSRREAGMLLTTQCAILFFREEQQRCFAAVSGRQEVIHGKCLQLLGFCSQTPQK